MTHEAKLQADQTLVEGWLQEHLDGLWPFGKLVESMGYSLLSGGKRIRPVLTLAACRLCGGEVRVALPLACALEMVHTYSLIHDDLPCMDDDDFRRGKPTNHRVFGQATAVLAGDALLTNAFEVLARAPELPAERQIQAVRCLSEAAGPAGMVAGQILDMDGTGHALSFDQIRKIEALKTGRMIMAALELGCIAAGEDGDRREALLIYGEKLGLAFQVQDDILDQEGEAEELGKSIGSDLKQGKATFVSLAGVEVCRRLVEDLTDEAAAAIAPYKEREFLCWLAGMLAKRRT
jgi:geranylgeranyl diphosphate synthase type II